MPPKTAKAKVVSKVVAEATRSNPVYTQHDPRLQPRNSSVNELISPGTEASGRAKRRATINFNQSLAKKSKPSKNSAAEQQPLSTQEQFNNEDNDDDLSTSPTSSRSKSPSDRARQNNAFF